MLRYLEFSLIKCLVFIQDHKLFIYLKCESNIISTRWCPLPATVQLLYLGTLSTITKYFHYLVRRWLHDIGIWNGMDDMCSKVNAYLLDLSRFFTSRILKLSPANSTATIFTNWTSGLRTKKRCWLLTRQAVDILYRSFR